MIPKGRKTESLTENVRTPDHVGTDASSVPAPEGRERKNRDFSSSKSRKHKARFDPNTVLPVKNLLVDAFAVQIWTILLIRPLNVIHQPVLQEPHQVER